MELTSLKCSVAFLKVVDSSSLIFSLCPHMWEIRDRSPTLSVIVNVLASSESSFVAYVRDVPGSNLDRDADCTDVSCDCPQSFQTAVAAVP